MRRALLVLIGAVALLLPTVVIGTASASPTTLRVGQVTLRHCALGTPRPAWCGSIRTPLDPGDATAGTIAIGFGWLPASSAARGTVVAMEGGPGYPSTGTAPDFAAMFGRGLLAHRNMLVVDARGTGRSTPIDCEPLQSLPSPSPRFTAAVTACGRQLNHTFRGTDGNWVHASDLFTTALTAGDVARVIGALKLGKVDLYGDSYGTYFSQSFLSQYPQLLRSVVLDSAYEARDLDPWYTTTVQTARTAFDTVCRRALDCARGSSWHRIGRLAALLRRHAIVGPAVGTDARRLRVRFGVTALVNVVNDAGYDFDPYRQLDAAVRAYLDHRDGTPLLRLYAQDIGYDYSDYSAKADYYSDGLYMAVACTDYPQLFDMSSPVAARRRELTASIRALPARTFAPFTTREWLRVLPYTETYTGCLTWPRPTHPDNPPIPRHVAIDASHVPVLILNGSLDSLTPAAGGAHIKRQIGSAARAVVVANEVHLTALDSPYACGPSLVRAFVRHPKAQLDTSCARHVPAVRAVPRFARVLARMIPARGAASLSLRRRAAVAVAEAGDALIRFDYVDGYRDLGLRGGTVHYDKRGDATLRGVRYTADTIVNGTVRVTARGGAGRLRVTGPHGHTATFRVRWGSGRHATVTTCGHTLTAPAP